MLVKGGFGVVVATASTNTILINTHPCVYTCQYCRSSVCMSLFSFEWVNIVYRNACITTPWIGVNHFLHDDVIKWKHFPRYWPFVRGIHQLPVTSPHKGPWRGALMFSLICDWINGWVNNREAGDLRRHGAHYDVTVMFHCSSLAEETLDYLWYS